jgi:hypothetical protein
MSDDIIKRALGMDIEPVGSDNALVVQPEVHLEDEVEMDFEYVRQNLTDLIAQGKDSIEELIMIAKQSQHPRAFEVIATLIKATADVNSDLLAVHKKKNDLRPSQATHSKGVSTVTNNNLFVGSTAELQEFLDQQQNKKHDKSSK